MMTVCIHVVANFIQSKGVTDSDVNPSALPNVKQPNKELKGSFVIGNLHVVHQNFSCYESAAVKVHESGSFENNRESMRWTDITEYAQAIILLLLSSLSI